MAPVAHWGGSGRIVPPSPGSGSYGEPPQPVPMARFGQQSYGPPLGEVHPLVQGRLSTGGSHIFTASIGSLPPALPMGAQEMPSTRLASPFHSQSVVGGRLLTQSSLVNLTARVGGPPIAIPSPYREYAPVSYREGSSRMQSVGPSAVPSAGPTPPVGLHQRFQPQAPTEAIGLGAPDELPLLARWDHEDAVQAQTEIEALRQTVAVRDEQLRQLASELKAARESEAKFSAEVQVARAEVARLAEELRLERYARDQAEATAAEATAAASSAAAPDGGKARPARRSPPPQGRPSSSRSLAPAPKARGRSAEAAVPGTPELSTSARRGPSRGPPPVLRPPQRDEVDNRLRELVEHMQCTLTFRKVNRGWYAFRRRDETGPQSADATVEISIVNGKLMAKLEASTHDRGWNNGKLGTIEKFIATYSA